MTRGYTPVATVDSDLEFWEIAEDLNEEIDTDVVFLDVLWGDIYLAYEWEDDAEWDIVGNFDEEHELYYDATDDLSDGLPSEYEVVEVCGTGTRQLVKTD